MDKDKIIQLTKEYGGEYGLNHTGRILNIVSLIDEGLNYNRDVVWVSAHLHDWGAYPKWVKGGVDHTIRSKQVAEEFLMAEGCKEDFICHVLECIEYHHGSNETRSVESQLLIDADAIDFMGVVGVLREFSTKPREMRKAVESAKNRMEKNMKFIRFEQSKKIAEERIKRAEILLAEFEEEAFGIF